MIPKEMSHWKKGRNLNHKMIQIFHIPERPEILIANLQRSADIVDIRKSYPNAEIYETKTLPPVNKSMLEKNISKNDLKIRIILEDHLGDLYIGWLERKDKNIRLYKNIGFTSIPLFFEEIRGLSLFYTQELHS